MMAAGRHLPTRVGRIRLDAPYLSRFVVQTLEPTTLDTMDQVAAVVKGMDGKILTCQKMIQ